MEICHYVLAKKEKNLLLLAAMFNYFFNNGDNFLADPKMLNERI